MANYNKVFLMGNVTRDPQIKQLPGGTAVVEFGLATNRKWKDKDSGQEKEDVCFVDCTAFGKQADVIAQYVTKGKPLFVEGRLKLDQWEDKKDGSKRSKLTVVVENFQFLGSRDDAGGQNQPAGASEGRGNFRQAAGKAPAAPGVAKLAQADAPFGMEQVFDEADIPF